MEVKDTKYLAYGKFGIQRYLFCGDEIHLSYLKNGEKRTLKNYIIKDMNNQEILIKPHLAENDFAVYYIPIKDIAWIKKVRGKFY